MDWGVQAKGGWCGVRAMLGSGEPKRPFLGLEDKQWCYRAQGHRSPSYMYVHVRSIIQRHHRRPFRLLRPGPHRMSAGDELLPRCTDPGRHKEDVCLSPALSAFKRSCGDITLHPLNLKKPYHCTYYNHQDQPQARRHRYLVHVLRRLRPL
jgi:hypothetical protein